MNLEMGFAAEQSQEKLDRPDSPFASNEGLYKTPPETHKAKNPMKYNKFCKQYSIADAWLNGNDAKYQQKLSGRRSANFKFLYPYLKRSTCAFPYKDCFILIGEKSYTNVCTNIDVWLDGDFISTFESLVCHNNHFLVSTAIIEFRQDVPQLTHVTYSNSHMAINDDKALPSSVKCIVAVMHTILHYAVMEITIDTKPIKIFDGLLHWPLLDWKDHIIRAMKKWMLVNPFVVPDSAQFNADTAVYKIVGCSRKPKECVNGYDIIIAMQKGQLERG